MVFSERIRIRQQVWWAKPNKWRNRESYRNLLHRLGENHTLRDRHDPDERWHCCSLWQRTLSNKWNSREFALRHGCRVPTLYWWGRRVGTLPIATLPEHFVVRPIWGDSRRGVYVVVGDYELLRQRSYTKAQLLAALRRDRGWISRFPILVEEFIKTEADTLKLPIEFRFHMFGEAIGAIEIVQRLTPADTRYDFHSASWERFAQSLYDDATPGPAPTAPACLDEMCRHARTLATAYGTYVRVDFYASNRGCVFGEFSSIPAGGHGFSSFAEHYFGELWQATFPDRT